jgi:hypothetical protein
MYRHLLLSITLVSLLSVSCKGPEGPAGPPGEGDASLTDPSIQPIVINTYPLNGSVGPYGDFNGRITVRFNKIMDRASIKQAVSISSPLGDVLVDTTSVAVQNTDVFTFIPVDSRGSSVHFLWKIGVAYTVRIDSSAKDVNGNRLHAPFTATFVPEPHFRVVTISPLNGAKEVPISSRIDVSFNSLVDSSIFSAVGITPALSGRWIFNPAFPGPDSSVIHRSFTSSPIDTTYTVTIDSSAHDKYGNRLGQRFLSTFTTATFRIQSTSPLNAGSGVSLFTSIVVSFTGPIDTGSVRTSFVINPPVEGIFRWTIGASSFTFLPASRLRANSLYTVSIETTMASAAGPRMQLPYSFAFVTTPFQVSSTSPADGNTGIQLTRSISASFSDIVDTGSIRSSLSFNPPLALSFSLTDSATSFSCTPTLGLAGNTTYVAVLASSIRSTRGDTLPMPYSFSFSTLPFVVAGTTPANGTTNVSPGIAISLSFNGPLDTATIRPAFTISPSVSGSFSWSGGAPPLSFSFRPASLLANGTRYSVSLSTTLKAAAGSPLPAPYAFTFTTVPFAVLSTNLSNGSTGVALNQTIQIQFNAPIDTTGIQANITMAPHVAANIVTFQGSSNVAFVPIDAYAPGTRYTLTVSAAMRSQSGGTLGSPFSLVFTTLPFAIVDRSPANGSIGVSPSTIITYRFSTTIDTGSVRGAFEIRPAVAGTFYLSPPAYGFSFTPSTPLASATPYTVTLSTGMKTASGYNLPQTDTLRFATGN